MPHDLHGKELKIGDEVILLAKVADLQHGEDFCNATVESVHGRRPDGAKEHICALNTGVLVKCPDVNEDAVYVGGPTGIAVEAEGEPVPIVLKTIPKEDDHPNVTHDEEHKADRDA